MHKKPDLRPSGVGCDLAQAGGVGGRDPAKKSR